MIKDNLKVICRYGFSFLFRLLYLLDYIISYPFLLDEILPHCRQMPEINVLRGRGEALFTEFSFFLLKMVNQKDIIPLGKFIKRLVATCLHHVLIGQAVGFQSLILYVYLVFKEILVASLKVFLPDYLNTELLLYFSIFQPSIKGLQVFLGFLPAFGTILLEACGYRIAFIFL
ncbi:MAG: hypothetical protein ACM3Q2_16960 [Syntrophothermus sp.]